MPSLDRRTEPNLIRRRLNVVAVVVGLLAALVVVPAFEATKGDTASAADLSQFRPGNIISDRVFYNARAMDESQVQAFLNSKVGRCESGYTCLKDYRQTTWTRSADRYCPTTYSGGSSESAARIIVKVAQACGINPQVLVVTLQKEQGLVTSTGPSSSRYQIAMGYGCPDTAACDREYYGFFNQLYSAARQFKVYGMSTTFTWYAPGRVANVRYNPDASCGSSPVYIENQATANLYYYTPYQPNAAALAAGYGTGNYCSAYGNRNFYNYFTDWFGSTQVSSGSIIRVEGRSEYWLTVGTVKHHIASWNDYLVFASRLGSVVTVAPSYADGLATGSTVSRLVREASTQYLYLLQPDGTKHHFPSVQSVADFGYDPAQHVNLEQSQLNAFTTGPEVGSLFRVEQSDAVYLIDGTTKRHVTNPAALSYISQGRNGYVASMASDRVGRLGEGPVVLKPGTLARETGSPEVMLAVNDRTVLHIHSLELAAEFGATTPPQVLGNGALVKSTKVDGGLTPFVSCEGAVYFGAEGQMNPVSGSVAAGWTVTALPDGACALPKSTRSVEAPLFVRAPSRSEVYLVADGGQLRHVRSWELLQALNGDRPLRVIAWSQGAIDRAGVGAPLLADTSFIRFDGAPAVYFVENGQIRHVLEYASVLRLNGGKAPIVDVLPAKFQASYVIGEPIP